VFSRRKINISSILFIPYKKSFQILYVCPDSIWCKHFPIICALLESYGLYYIIYTLFIYWTRSHIYIMQVLIFLFHTVWKSPFGNKAGQVINAICISLTTAWKNG
jgi:hypothetical protein